MPARPVRLVAACMGLWLSSCAPPPSLARKDICGNGMDDNGNSKVDCGDPDCQGEPGCGDGGAEAPLACFDAIDNDNNGKKDCADPACLRQSCGVGCACTDGGVRGESECRGAPQMCGPAPSGGANVCYCRVAGENCMAGNQCCRGSCFTVVPQFPGVCVL